MFPMQTMQQYLNTPNENEKPAFLNSSRWKSVFEKLHFRHGLAWMVGPKHRNKAVFSNFSGLVQV